MPFSDETVNAVYNKTGGYCYYCGKKLSFVNYGKNGNHGSWHIDHSKPKSKGGTDYLRNWFRLASNAILTKMTGMVTITKRDSSMSP